MAAGESRSRATRSVEARVEGMGVEDRRRRFAAPGQRDRRDVLADQLAMPPAARLAKLRPGRVAVAVEPCPYVARRIGVGERVTPEKSAHSRVSLEQLLEERHDPVAGVSL